jgi:hypothetical protein
VGKKGKIVGNRCDDYDHQHDGDDVDDGYDVLWKERKREKNGNLIMRTNL